MIQFLRPPADVRSRYDGSQKIASKIRCFQKIQFPNEKRLVEISTLLPDGGGFIDAIHADSYLMSGEIICAQSPLPQTMAEFLAIAWERRVARIIALNGFNQGETPCYFPVDRGPLVGPRMGKERIMVKPFTVRNR